MALLDQLDDEDAALVRRFLELPDVLSGIVHGGLSGPTGLEALTMAISPLNQDSLSTSVLNVAESLQSIADAITGLTDVLKSS